MSVAIAEISWDGIPVGVFDRVVVGPAVLGMRHSGWCEKWSGGDGRFRFGD